MAMRSSYTQLYAHLVWATWDRLPLITRTLKPLLYAALADKCRELQCAPLAIGGIDYHVHLSVRLHSTVAIAILDQEGKGSASHLVTHEIAPGIGFKWQGAYGAFTISPQDVPRIRRYIECQAEHHASGKLHMEWEQTHNPDDTPDNTSLLTR
jgi:REP element-mobilizing transposase RayT